MNCHEAQRLLSAYHDDELPAEVRTSVAEHVRGCPCCGDELAVFGELSAMARGLDDPQPPEAIWAGIEAALDADRQETASPAGPAAARARVTKRRLGLLATAAVVLVAAGVAWFATRLWHAPSRPGEVAVDFGEFLEHFPEDPERAQQVLMTKYDGRAVDLSQAARRAGYRPAVAAGLPKRYTLDGVYVLKMPCCTCVQAICRRDDGRVFAIFEHDEEHPAWLGAGPCVDTECQGCPCCVMRAGRGVVASWKADKRHLTVVGARDLQDVADLIGHFRTTRPGA